MGIKVSWADDNRTIIQATYGDRWGWDDWRRADDQTQALLDAVEHPVGLILDARRAAIPPDIVVRFPRIAQTAPGLTSPKVHTVVVVGKTFTLNSLVGLMKRLYPDTAAEVEVVPTLEEAFIVVRESAPTAH
ncbi:MAG: hypothetical protein Kow00124_25750 [Anaerolineae bacterium]